MISAKTGTTYVADGHITLLYIIEHYRNSHLENSTISQYLSDIGHSFCLSPVLSASSFLIVPSSTVLSLKSLVSCVYDIIGCSPNCQLDHKGRSVALPNFAGIWMSLTWLTPIDLNYWNMLTSSPKLRLKINVSVSDVMKYCNTPLSHHTAYVNHRMFLHILV
jgi:hypothetical protein